MDVFKSVVLLAVCFFCVLITLADAEGEEAKLTIAPRPDQAVRVEDSVTFTCSMENKTIEWIKDGTQISQNNKTRIYYNGGDLNINSANLNDTGSYICRTTDHSFNATADLKVYVMPTYFMEGMIIVGINCGLILLFILCGINSILQAKRDRRRRKEDTYKKAAPI